jgi:ribonuclease R
MSFSKDAVLSALGQSYAEGLKFGDIAQMLAVKKKDQPRLRKLLVSMVRDGVIARAGRARYTVASPSAVPNLVGRITVHPAGYGFVAMDDGSDDVFVPAKFRGLALDGDRVLLETWDGRKGTEGAVQEVLSRGRAKLTGTLQRAGRTIYCEPDDPRIGTDYGHVTLVDGPGKGKVGESVVIEITKYPTEEVPLISGRVSRVLGDPDDPRTEIEKILVCADVPVEFPAEAVTQAEGTAQELDTEDFADRIDLRDREFVTIDPSDARDHDDAMCIEAGPHGPRVWVAIADVSHYVRPDDALDQEASIRGVSVYLPDRVIPMLPFPLSSGICSLKPDVDRCAMVVRLDYDADGELQDTAFAAAIIRSHARLDYAGVAAALSGDFRGRRAHYRRWAKSLEKLDHLAQQLRADRLERGSLNLDLPEPKVILDADDPLLIRDVIRQKGDEGVKQAYQLVEEFMIAANEAVGAYFRRRDKPCVWRIHAGPEAERVEELAEVLASFGIKVDVSHAMSPVGMKDVLEAINELPAAHALSFLVLRSLKQAAYDTTPVGHFGLASEDYLHFTSPIRRYADLLVHRLLKHHLHAEGQASGGGGRFDEPTIERLQELAAATSGHERRALEAEREAVGMYRAYIMRDQVGEQKPGRVSGVTNFGAFIEMDEPFVEGLVKLDNMGDDRYVLDPVKMRLSAKRSGHSVALGDDVEVEIVSVSVAMRRIELRLLSSESNAPKGKGRARRPKKSKTGPRGAKGKGGKSVRSKGRKKR